MITLKNTQPLERRAIASLALIMSLRMMGLFMVLPLFALYATQLKGATDTLIGIAIGIYGLSQALCQIPLGALSDRIGRKPVICIGLLIFSLGSFIAGHASSIEEMILGRTLQGVGAIGGTTLAMLADLTRDEIRTVSMAIIGMTIGASFSLAMLVGPLLIQWLSLSSLFFIAGGLGLVGIIVLYTYTPTPTDIDWHRETSPAWRTFFKLLVHPELAILNGGIFILHAIFTASFIIIPISLFRSLHLQASHQWFLYLPTLLIAFVIALFLIGIAERKAQLKIYFLGGIITLAFSEAWLWIIPKSIGSASVGLCLFFASFSLLEALLPSMISRIAPKERKGSALGLYSCSQFLGIFVGGALGGWLFGRYPLSGIYLLCIILALFWFAFTLFIQPPHTQQH